MVKVACDGCEAIKRATAEDFALIILDRMLPGLSGLDVCTKLRDGGNRSPILMLTAKDTLEDKIEGLKGGADDYLTKPFAFNEMLARIEALLRRSAPAERAAVLEVADLRMDLAARQSGAASANFRSPQRSSRCWHTSWRMPARRSAGRSFWPKCGS